MAKSMGSSVAIDLILVSRADTSTACRIYMSCVYGTQTFIVEREKNQGVANNREIPRQFNP